MERARTPRGGIPLAVGLAAAVTVIVVGRSAFATGSILGVLLLVAAGLVGLGAGALVRATRSAASRSESVSALPLSGPRPVRIVGGLLVATVALGLAVLAWWASIAAATGCSFHCDAEPRPVLGLAIGLIAGVVAGRAAALAAWSVSDSPAVRRRAGWSAGVLGVVLSWATIASAL